MIDLADFPILQIERLFLSQITPEDAPALFQCAST